MLFPEVLPGRRCTSQPLKGFERRSRPSGVSDSELGVLTARHLWNLTKPGSQGSGTQLASQSLRPVVMALERQYESFFSGRDGPTF